MTARLLVCYFPGLDGRRIGAERTPFLDELRATCPTVSIGTIPGTDLLPTLLTGVYPHEHRAWQVSLRAGARLARPRRLGDRLPDVVTTTLQCLRGLVDPAYDLGTVPPWRRRQFDMHRLAWRRERHGRAVDRIGLFRTLFGILAADARYLHLRRPDGLSRLSGELATGECALEFLEVASLDLVQHWYMDEPRRLDAEYRAADALVQSLHATCEQRGVTLMVLADRGQEPVRGSIPLMTELQHGRVPERDYSFFVELALARFWFHTEEARVRLTERLHAIPHTRLLTRRVLRDLQLAFEDDDFGELFLAAEPGWIFFPHDFYQPLVNLCLGLADPQQRPRLVQPRHRGANGYLPEHPSERGFAILADGRYRALRTEAELVDVAPTLLALLGKSPPAYMRGHVVFG